MKESGLICGSHAQLMCTILVYRSRLYMDFRLISLKCLNSQYFPQKSISHEMPHFMQFSVDAHELCMLHCVLLDCNGPK